MFLKVLYNYFTTSMLFFTRKITCMKKPAIVLVKISQNINSNFWWKFFFHVIFLQVCFFSGEHFNSCKNFHVKLKACKIFHVPNSYVKKVKVWLD